MFKHKICLNSNFKNLKKENHNKIDLKFLFIESLNLKCEIDYLKGEELKKVI